MQAAPEVRRRRAMRLLRDGLASVSEAARVARVSRQCVLEWCKAAGIDVRARRLAWLALQIARADREEHEMARMNWSRSKGKSGPNKPTQDSKYEPGLMAPLLRGRGKAASPNKAELRRAGIALAAGAKVTRLAELVKLRCVDCGKRSEGRPRADGKLRCSKCRSFNCKRIL